MDLNEFDQQAAVTLLEAQVVLRRAERDSLPGSTDEQLTTLNDRIAVAFETLRGIVANEKFSFLEPEARDILNETVGNLGRGWTRIIQLERGCRG